MTSLSITARMVRIIYVLFDILHDFLHDITSWLYTSDPRVCRFPDDDGSGGEESGSGCDSPSCDTDQDIYFSTPPNPGNPRVNQVVVGKGPSGGGVVSQGSMALALCGLALALLAPHLR